MIAAYITKSVLQNNDRSQGSVIKISSKITRQILNERVVTADHSRGSA